MRSNNASGVRAHGIAVVVAAWLGLCAGPSAAQTPQPCPWLTAGTAAAVLGGAPLMAVKTTGPAEGTCSFSVKEGSSTSVLEVVVGSQLPVLCPAGSVKISAVGNEATLCQVRHPGMPLRTIIESRVRAIYFTASLTLARNAPERANPAQAGSGQEEQKQQETLESVAEQIAGNLY